mgnify:CR=1 FL=1
MRLTRKSAKELLLELYKEDLKEIARIFRLPVSGTKSELVETILNNVKLSELSKTLELYFEEEELESKSKPEKKEIDAEKLFRDTVKLLKKLKLPRLPKVKDEDDLKLYISGFLQGAYQRRKIEVRNEVLGIKGQVDILVGNAVVVEVKYIKGAAEADKGIGQAKRYAKMYPYVILYYYDPQKRSHHDKSSVSEENMELITYPR